MQKASLQIHEHLQTLLKNGSTRSNEWSHVMSMYHHSKF